MLGAPLALAPAADAGHMHRLARPTGQSYATFARFSLDPSLHSLSEPDAQHRYLESTEKSSENAERKTRGRATRGQVKTDGQITSR